MIAFYIKYKKRKILYFQKKYVKNISKCIIAEDNFFMFSTGKNIIEITCLYIFILQLYHVRMRNVRPKGGTNILAVLQGHQISCAALHTIQ